MGTDIEAARSPIDWGARRPCAGGAIADAALGLEGAVAGRRLGSSGGPPRPAGRQGGPALALRPPLGPRRDS